MKQEYTSPKLSTFAGAGPTNAPRRQSSVASSRGSGAGTGTGPALSPRSDRHKAGTGSFDFDSLHDRDSRQRLGGAPDDAAGDKREQDPYDSPTAQPMKEWDRDRDRDRKSGPGEREWDRLARQAREKSRRYSQRDGFDYESRHRRGFRDSRNDYARDYERERERGPIDRGRLLRGTPPPYPVEHDADARTERPHTPPPRGAHDAGPSGKREGSTPATNSNMPPSPPQRTYFTSALAFFFHRAVKSILLLFNCAPGLRSRPRFNSILRVTV